jgi:hypothetical protein
VTYVGPQLPPAAPQYKRTTRLRSEGDHTRTYGDFLVPSYRIPSFSPFLRPFEWCSSEDRRATGVGPPLRRPHTHHEESTQIARPESEGPWPRTRS